MDKIISAANVLEPKPRLINTALERVVLAGIVKFGMKSFVDVDDVLRVSSFTDPTNQALYICIKDILSKDTDRQIDYPSLIAQMGLLGFGKLIHRQIEQEHVRSIFDTDVETTTIRPFATQLRKLEIARGMVNKLKTVQTNLFKLKGDESLSQILGLVEAPIFEFVTSLGEDKGPTTLKDGMKDYVQHLIENPRKLIGVSSGFPTYDIAIGGGFRRKSVSIVGARMKVGKSTLSLNIAQHVTETLNIPVLYLDAEMSKEEQQIRFVSGLSNIEVNHLERGEVSYHQKEKLFGAIDRLSNNFYHEDIAGKEFEEVLSVVRRWLHKVVGFQNGSINDCLIILDYLKLMDDSGLNKNVAEYQKLGFMMTGLYNFAKKYDLPIFCTLQLNRDGINKETTDVVSGSDRILWTCANFTIFKAKTPEEIAEDGPEQGNRKLVPLICRHGEGLPEGDYINMQMRGKYAKVIEVSTRNQVAFEPKPDADDISDEF